MLAEKVVGGDPYRDSCWSRSGVASLLLFLATARTGGVAGLPLSLAWLVGWLAGCLDGWLYDNRRWVRSLPPLLPVCRCVCKCGRESERANEHTELGTMATSFNYKVR
ncbi:hypothetical protein KM043_008166 [Ampulex compressa]|nr:hypothetical protein KM043_008166 [Ampulex compressa]